MIWVPDLSVPLIWTPEQEPDESSHELDLLIERAVVEREVLMGNAQLSDYCDLLNDQGYYVEEALEAWSGEG